MVTKGSLRERRRHADGQARARSCGNRSAYAHRRHEAAYRGHEAPNRIASVEEAIRCAEAAFPTLRFLRSAKKAARDSPFSRPGELYEALAALAELAVVRR